MDKLKAAQLYGGQLISVTGTLVERYNQCLSALGFKPTELASFSIDGIGWSPEIAEEKDDLYYLNNGEANPHAIILSPKQQGVPVYMPFHSFDREVMALVYDTFKNTINDITKDSAICVDLDQFIDAFYEPMDLLKYNKISVGFKLLNDLDEVQIQQAQLIETYRQGNNFIDENLHIQLLGLARKYGDLRNRKLTMEPLEFTTESFYTKAFGGVFVLRDFIKPILVFESEEWYKKTKKQDTGDVLIHHIVDKSVVKQLIDHIIITYDLKDVVKTKRYERIKKFIFMEKLQETEHPIQNILDDQILYKSYLNKLATEDRDAVLSVERYNEQKALGKSSLIDDMFLKALYEPHSSLDDKQQELIWKLLVKMSAKDPLYLYWYDKESFYKAYQSWDESFKDWVIEYITKHN